MVDLSILSNRTIPDQWVHWAPTAGARPWPHILVYQLGELVGGARVGSRTWSKAGLSAAWATDKNWNTGRTAPWVDTLRWADAVLAVEDPQAYPETATADAYRAYRAMDLRAWTGPVWLVVTTTAEFHDVAQEEVRQHEAGDKVSAQVRAAVTGAQGEAAWVKADPQLRGALVAWHLIEPELRAAVADAVRVLK